MAFAYLIVLEDLRGGRKGAGGMGFMDPSPMLLKEAFVVVIIYIGSSLRLCFVYVNILSR